MKSKKALFIWYEFEAAIKAITPAVKFTRKVLTCACMIPHHLIAPMGTHIVKSVDRHVVLFFRFVERGEDRFLKTIIPSRKLPKHYKLTKQ